MKNKLHVGLDIGSTTIKIVVLDDNLKTLYSSYTRHFSDTKKTLSEVLLKFIKDYPDSEFTMSLTGSGASRFQKPWHCHPRSSTSDKVRNASQLSRGRDRVRELSPDSPWHL